MSLSSQQQEQVVQLLHEQTATYRQAIPIAETLSQNFDVSPERQQQLTELDRIMIQAGHRYMEMMEVVSAERMESYPAEIQQASRDLTDLLERLMPMIESIENRAKEVRKRLYPEVNQSMRAQQMQNAYGASADD